MKIVEQYVFDDEDRRLLSIEIPDNPCDKCYQGTSSGCYGCPSYTEYLEIIKPYKDRNIYNLALKFKRMKLIDREIERLKEELEKVKKEIKDTGIFS